MKDKTGDLCDMLPDACRLMLAHHSKAAGVSEHIVPASQDWLLSEYERSASWDLWNRWCIAGEHGRPEVAA